MSRGLGDVYKRQEKKDIQLEEVGKREEIDESKEKESYRSVKINMKKVPLKEITD